jgi:hypothetical protein
MCSPPTVSVQACCPYASGAVIFIDFLAIDFLRAYVQNICYQVVCFILVSFLFLSLKACRTFYFIYVPQYVLQ